ncbi:hypothetical protein NKI96_32280, partial [Mesorhizobium sp. M0292]|uniref:hypothetical protein n=1 Tax=Mesorhizobium sp. M0292 TaxID=2956929 RepID=UPI003336E4C3
SQVQILSPQPTKKARFTRAFCVRTVIDGDFNLHRGPASRRSRRRGTEKPNHGPNQFKARSSQAFLYSAPLPARSRLAPGSVSAATATRRRDRDRTLWTLQNQATNHSLAIRSWKTNRDRALPIIVTGL